MVANPNGELLDGEEGQVIVDQIRTVDKSPLSKKSAMIEGNMNQSPGRSAGNVF